MDNQSETAVLYSPLQVVDQLDDQTKEIVLNNEPLPEESQSDDTEILLDEPLLIVDEEINQSATITEDDSLPSTTKNVLSYSDLEKMFESLKASPTTKRKWDMNIEDFKALFKDGKTIDGNFTRNELQAALKPVIGKLKSEKYEVNISSTKQIMVSILSTVLGDGSFFTRSRKTSSWNAKTLQCLCKKIVSKFPKDVLSAIQAEHIVPDRLEEWYHRFAPFGDIINIAGVPENLNSYNNQHWFSTPEYNDVTGNYLFMILDSCRQLCGFRRLVCQSGIPAKGIKKSAFIKVAEENSTGLNIAMVGDLIDKQNVEFAQTTFSEKVACALEKNGDIKEAEMCRLIDQWYQSEYEAGISATDRCIKRLQLRE